MSNYRWSPFEMFGDSPNGQRFVSVGGSKGGGGYSVSTPTLNWLPGQEAYGPDYLANLKAIFGGDLSSPQAKMLTMLTKEAGMKEAAQERRRVSSTPGLTAPAKAKSLGQLAGSTTSTMAGVPGKVWGYASDVLSKYMLTPPTVSTSTFAEQKPTKSFQGGICSCTNLRTLNEGELEASLRKFRDGHFHPYGLLERGYKRMAEWFVPLISRSKMMRVIGRMWMLFPLSQVARWVEHQSRFGFIYLPFAYLWIGFWKVYGIGSVEYGQRSPRMIYTSYPSMTSTFISRVREIF